MLTLGFHYLPFMKSRQSHIPFNSNFLKRSLANYENLCHQFSRHFPSPPPCGSARDGCEALRPGKCSLQSIKVKDHTTARVLWSYSFSMFNVFTVSFPSMSRLSESHAVSDSAALFLGLQTGSVPCRHLKCEDMTNSLFSVNHVGLSNFWKGRERLSDISSASSLGIGCRDLPELILVDLRSPTAFSFYWQYNTVRSMKGHTNILGLGNKYYFYLFHFFSPPWSIMLKLLVL